MALKYYIDPNTNLITDDQGNTFGYNDQEPRFAGFWQWLAGGGTPERIEAPIVIVPEQVTMFQARAALMQAGLFEVVDAHCKAAGGIVLQAWEYANHCYRNGALIQSLGAELGLTGEQIDALFIAAEGIEA